MVNCTGLGAATLFGDREMLPIKGQLTVLVPQPEVDYLTTGPGDLYMMPRRDGIILGGTHERDEWSLDPNQAEAARILQGHQELFSRWDGGPLQESENGSSSAIRGLRRSGTGATPSSSRT